jgi:hypothetical protein
MYKYVHPAHFLTFAISSRYLTTFNREEALFCGELEFFILQHFERMDMEIKAFFAFFERSACPSSNKRVLAA